MKIFTGTGQAVCVVFVGGNWNNGRNCSPVYFNCNIHPSNSNINRLARLFIVMTKTIIFYACSFPCPLAEIVATAGVSKMDNMLKAPETIKKTESGDIKTE